MACEKLQDVFYGCTARPLLIDEPMSRHTSFKIGGLYPPRRQHRLRRGVGTCYQRSHQGR